MASAPAAAAPASDINDKELRDSFSKIDTDRSGKISRAEIAAFFRRHGRRVEEKEIDDAINFADTNKDGQVCIEEFISSFMAGRRTAAPVAPAKAAEQKAPVAI